MVPITISRVTLEGSRLPEGADVAVVPVPPEDCAGTFGCSVSEQPPRKTPESINMLDKIAITTN
jgi:hypothetical protein